ncbi:hypothetical protein K402DRAFT_219078 [Aulographum hederae CBS 113979]|uniref:Cytochrome b561 domain-containing protein n=1 Tax=Aulographum hederae CBS 113979 TaxID=1176131 RepID=A0A6G1GLP8_9PEZI|nr:hypothetical protein K402DRAFT_219078 [Aulographum hederae CBS 113979]
MARSTSSSLSKTQIFTLAVLVILNTTSAYKFRPSSSSSRSLRSVAFSRGIAKEVFSRAAISFPVAAANPLAVASAEPEPTHPDFPVSPEGEEDDEEEDDDDEEEDKEEDSAEDEIEDDSDVLGSHDDDGDGESDLTDHEEEENEALLNHKSSEETRDHVSMGHAIIMSGAFGIIFPSGAIMMRALRSKYLVRWHAALQVTGVICVLAGTILGAWMVWALERPMSDPHIIIGIITVATIFILPFIGYRAHQDYKNNMYIRQLLGHVHMWMARSFIFTGIANGAFGLWYADQASSGSRRGYIIGAILMMGAWGAVVCNWWWKERKIVKRRSSNKRSWNNASTEPLTRPGSAYDRRRSESVDIEKLVHTTTVSDRRASSPMRRELSETQVLGNEIVVRGGWKPGSWRSDSDALAILATPVQRPTQPRPVARKPSNSSMMSKESYNSIDELILRPMASIPEVHTRGAIAYNKPLPPDRREALWIEKQASFETLSTQPPAYAPRHRQPEMSEMWKTGELG